MEVADLRVLGRDREVAVDQNLEAAGSRSLVALTDGLASGRSRRRSAPNAGPPRKPRFTDEVALKLVEVESRAERALTPADDHHADVGIVLGTNASLVQLLQELLTDGIALVGRLSQMRATGPSTSYWIGSTSTTLVCDHSSLIELK